MLIIHWILLKFGDENLMDEVLMYSYSVVDRD